MGETTKVRYSVYLTPDVMDIVRIASTAKGTTVQHFIQETLENRAIAILDALDQNTLSLLAVLRQEGK